MGSQSGIGCSNELANFLSTSRGGSIRMIKVQISSHSTPALELENKWEASGSWEEDWEALVSKALQDDQPCYILFRLDERDASESFFWTLIAWTPDDSPTRQKMLYASTKATFKKQFGAGQVKEDYYANHREEVSLAGYKKFLAVEAAPGPLSQAEEEQKAIKEAEARTEVSVDSKHNTLSGLAFPLQPEATVAIREYSQGTKDYVQLAIDLTKETVEVVESGGCPLDQLPGKVPNDVGRYHLFRFKHTHEGDSLESNVFIYSMPGYSVPIKERMMYSSCKNAVVEMIGGLGVNLEKSLEVDSGSELTEEYLQGEIHPVKSLNKPKFAKPKGPSKAGAKRITKTPVSPSS